MIETKFRFFEFGEFRLDAHRRILQKNGEPVHLTPRSFDLLCVMVENAGRVLKHDELLDKVWEGTFVEQGNLKKTISSLRQALGESPETSEFITTVPRKGYRFTAPVRPVADEQILIRETKAEIIVEEEYEDSLPVASLPAARPERKSFFQKLAYPLIAAALIVPLVWLAVWFFSRKNRNDFSVEKVRQTKVVSTDSLSSGVLSGSGDFFAFSVAEKGKKSLRVKFTRTGSELEIVPAMNASFWTPAFTPDGHYLYFYLFDRDNPSKNGVYRIPTLGGPLQLITEKQYNGLKFSPDGKRLAAYRTFVVDGRERQELLTIDADGGDERQIKVLPDYELFRGVAWSPDGASLLYGVKRQTPFDKGVGFISEISVDGGAEKTIMPEQENLFQLEDWLPDKKSLVLREREQNSEIYQIWQYFPDSGEKRRVTNDDYSYFSANVTTDGKTIGAARLFGLSSIWTADTERYDFRQIAGSDGYYFQLGWTADDRLVFSSMENGREFVGIMNQDGSNRRLLTDGADGIRPVPEVTGSGTAIVFTSERSGGRQVWTMDFEGRNVKKLTSTIGIGTARMLSDGRTLFFTSYLKTGTWSLMKQAADGQIVEISGIDTLDWDISPDEKYVAVFTLDEKTKKNRLEIREIENNTVIKSFEISGLRGVNWTRDGQQVCFMRSGEDLDQIVCQPLSGAAERVIVTVRSEDIRNFDFSRDGKRIALVRNKARSEAILIQPGREN